MIAPARAVEDGEGIEMQARPPQLAE